MDTHTSTPAESRPVAMVTGAAKRIGREIARTLHEAGFDLAIHCSRSIDEARELAGELEAARPHSTLVLQMDLANTERLPSLIESTLARFGRLDALINNASSFFPTPIESVTPQQWGVLFDSNAKGPFFLAQAAAPALRQSEGTIVSVGDMYADRAYKDHAIYVMAKAALHAMTRALALDLAPSVRVNAIAPGAVLWPDTPSPYENQGELIARTPLRRAGHPCDIAAGVLWLIRGAHFMTGQVLTIDGGRSIPG